MKLKRLPEDFRVDEVLAPSLTSGAGAFAHYRLTKKSLGTLEAIAALSRHWKIPRQAIAFAGLKDRHALTTQYLTIHHGPRRGFQQTNLAVEYLGQLERPIHASDIEENRFQIVLRHLSRQQAERFSQAATTVAATGLPNYFDDQRFGSLGKSGQFIALPWCLGDYERALWLALTDENLRDRPFEREEKLFLREHWGDWSASARRWPRSRFAPVLEHLARDPQDFRRAIARVSQDLRSLWLAAFQSHLWNQVLAVVIREHLAPAALGEQTIGQRKLPHFVGPFEEAGPPGQIGPIGDAPPSLHTLLLPLPSARLHLTDDRLRPWYETALASEGIELRQIRVKYPRDSFFSKGERAAIFRPTQFGAPRIEPDDLFPDMHKLRLQFSLSRGLYATIFIKGICGQLPADTSPPTSEFEDDLGFDDHLGIE